MITSVELMNSARSAFLLSKDQPRHKVALTSSAILASISGLKYIYLYNRDKIPVQSARRPSIG